MCYAFHSMIVPSYFYDDFQMIFRFSVSDFLCSIFSFLFHFSSAFSYPFCTHCAHRFANSIHSIPLLLLFDFCLSHFDFVPFDHILIFLICLCLFWIFYIYLSYEFNIIFVNRMDIFKLYIYAIWPMSIKLPYHTIHSFSPGHSIILTFKLMLVGGGA